MSISMELFAAEQTYVTYDPFRMRDESVAMFTLSCRSCGFELDRGMVVPPKRCAKCGSAAWERSANPGSLLANARRR